MAKNELLRAQFDVFPDEQLVRRYSGTLDMIETVDISQHTDDGLERSNSRELLYSRNKLHRELAVLGLLLAERDIQL